MTPEREEEVRKLVARIAESEGKAWGRTPHGTPWETMNAPGVLAFEALPILLAALDEARRERDEWAQRAGTAHADVVLAEAARNEAKEAAGADKLHLFCELKNARAREASERTWRERAEASRDAAEAETFAARAALCALLDAHASPSDATRAAGHRAAMETRRGWGM